MKTYKNAIENQKIAEYSEGKKYFEIATSRYYYAIYLILIKYLKSLPSYVHEESEEGKDSHKKTIDKFLEKMENIVTEDEYDTLKYIRELRKQRNDYEYKKNYQNERIYKRNFLKKYKEIEEILFKHLDEYTQIKNSFER